MPKRNLESPTPKDPSDPSFTPLTPTAASSSSYGAQHVHPKRPRKNISGSQLRVQGGKILKGVDINLLKPQVDLAETSELKDAKKSKTEASGSWLKVVQARETYEGLRQQLEDVIRRSGSATSPQSKALIGRIDQAAKRLRLLLHLHHWPDDPLHGEGMDGQ